ncbi:MAG TPA: E3 binding domain-containing protein, partial [Anaerolineaceae bacterium]|nr:E3 binding domain-containing protein [Anaerolineaceae bacterium]
MADVVIMPKLGFDMAEGTLVRWVKGEGDTVNKGDVLAEIETDKATVEVESNFGGVLYKQLVDQDTVVPVGTPIAVVAEPGETPDLSQFTGADVQEGEEPGAKPSEPVREMPDEAGPKDTVREEAPAAGAETAPEAQAPTPGAEVEAEAEEIETGDGRVKASPVARRMADEQGIDLSRLQGSGPGGRIVRKDVEAAAETAKAGPAPAPAAPAAPAAAPRDERPAAAKPE